MEPSGDPSEPTPISPTRASLDRRTLLQAAGALALAPAVAGCVGGEGTGESVGERPGYSRWIGADALPESSDDEEFLFVRADFQAFREYGDGDAFSGIDEGAEDGQFQLVMAPLFGAVTVILVSSMGLFPYGDAALEVVGSIEAGMSEEGEEPAEGDEPGGDGPAHQVDAGVVVGDVSEGALVAYEGSFDLDSFEANVEAFEAVDESAGFTIYEGVEDAEGSFDTSELAFAIGEDAALFPLSNPDSDPLSEDDGDPSPPDSAPDPRDLLDSHVAVYSGEAEEAAEADEDFDWSLRAGGAEDHVISGYGLDDFDSDPTAEEDPAEESAMEFDELDALLRDAETFTISTSFDVEEEVIDAAGGFVYPDESARPEASDFEALAPTATDASVDVDGHRVRVEATWEADDGEES